MSRDPRWLFPICVLTAAVLHVGLSAVAEWTAPTSCAVVTPAAPYGLPAWVERVPTAFLAGAPVAPETCRVEYRFDWGDGAVSEWNGVGLASHTWWKPGRYEVRCQARLAADRELVSSWSAARRIGILPLPAALRELRRPPPRPPESDEREPVKVTFQETALIKERLPARFTIGRERKRPGPAAMAPAPRRRALARPPAPKRQPVAAPPLVARDSLKAAAPAGQGRLSLPKPDQTPAKKSRVRVTASGMGSERLKAMGESEQTQLRYIEAILQRIQAEMDKPEVQATLDGTRGIVRATFDLSNLGFITKAPRVVEPSRYPPLDKAICESIQRASPFPQFPVYILASEVRVVITVYADVPVPEEDQR